MLTEGGGGVQEPLILADVICEQPLMVMVHVKVVEGVTDIVEVVSVMDKHVYKVKDEISRELTKEVQSLFGQCSNVGGDNFYGSSLMAP